MLSQRDRGFIGAQFRESDYERARSWLEEEVRRDGRPFTIPEFKDAFNEGLYQKKGLEWQKEGLIVPTLATKQSREQFFQELQEVKQEKKRKVGFIQTKRGQRKVAFVRVTIKGKKYRRGQYVPLTKREKRRLANTR